MTKKGVLLLVVFIFIIVSFLPVLTLLIKSLFPNGNFSIENYVVLFQSSRTWILLRNSLSLAVVATVVTLFLGIPLGILFSKTNLPFKELFTLLFTIPFIIPSYMIAIGWFYALAPQGILTRILGTHVTEIMLHHFFGFPGAVLVMTSVLLPVVVILTMTYLGLVDPKLEEAARLSSGWILTLRKISLPIISPGIFLAGLLVFALTLGEFGVPSFLRYNVFPVEAFTQFSAFYNFGAATAATIPLGIIILLIVIVERYFLRKRTFELIKGTGKEEKITIELNQWKVSILIFVIVFAAIIVFIPLGSLISKSVSLVACRETFVRSMDSVLRSLVYSSIGATLLTLFGFFLGYLLERKVFHFAWAIDSMAFFLFALPGTVIGIGLISLWNNPATNFIYASAAVIILGYIAQYAALGERMMAATYAQIPTSMEEAAQITGVGWFRRLVGIVAPMAKRGLIATWLIGFLFCSKDLGSTMMIYPPGHDTLPVRIFTLMANSPEEIIAALCVLMLGIAFLPLCALGVIFKKSRVKS
ncbi:MAG: iron ABC transporter permease [Candidatus Omnitrophica bacterium]|nr:iron ABC transporter permease [Candidatus Omnitrophota bacterium]